MVLWSVPSSAAGTRYVLITLLHTNDLHGHVEPEDGCGLARAASLVRQVRADMPHVLLFDAGDIIHGSAEDYYSGGMATIAAMNTAGYDATAVGNHELDFGLPVLQGVLATARFPFLSANLRSASGEQWDRIEPYRVLDVDGARVAVFGLTTLESVSLHWPGSIKDIRVDDPVVTAKRLVPELRSKADVVVLLSHLGVDGDAALAKSVPGIDFIIGGHSHTPVVERKWVNGTLIAQAGCYGKALGRIDFVVRVGERGSEVVSVNGRHGCWGRSSRAPLGKSYWEQPLAPVTVKIPEDHSVKEAYAPYRADVQSRLNEVIGYCHTEPEGYRQTASLVAGAVRSLAHSDVAMIDEGSVSQTGFLSGPVTLSAAFNAIGGFTRQQIVVGRVPGSGLLPFLARSHSSNQRHGYAISGPAIEAGRTYTLAAQAYVMMDLMARVPGIEIKSEFIQTTREALVEYLKTHPNALDQGQKAVDRG